MSEVQSNDPLAAAMDRAAAVANTTPAAGAVVPATGGAGAVAPLPAGKPRSLADAVATAGLQVDHYLKVTHYGLQIGDDKALFESLDGTLNLGEMKFPLMVRFDVAGSTQYKKSYDGIREAGSGKAWSDVVQLAQATDIKCKGSYDAVEIVLVLTKEVVGKSGTYKVGDRVGYTTPWSVYQAIMPWIKEKFEAGQVKVDLPASLQHVPKEKGSNKWGIFLISDKAG